MSNQRWFEQKEVGSRFFLAILTWVALKLGRGPARTLLIFITAYFYITGTQARRASRIYLQRILKKNPGWLETYRHFYFFSAVSLDRLFLLAGKYDCFDIAINGESVFDDLKKTHQGCLLFVSHVGSFDVMRVPGARDHALPISILMDQDHNSMAMQLLSRLDPVLAENVIDARQAKPELVLKMNAIINKGGMIGVMVDRLHNHDTATDCVLLDGKAALPTGPWQLAAVLQAPIVLCFGLYHGKNRYSIYFERFPNPVSRDRNERDRSIADCVQTYCTRLEHYLNLEPYNWFNFYAFWKNETAGD